MKKRRSVTVPPGLVKLYEKVPKSRSGAICQGITNATREPELLAHAFRLRLHKEPEEATLRIVFTIEPSLERKLEEMARWTDLPIEQVVRLSMEAFIYKL